MAALETRATDADADGTHESWLFPLAPVTRPPQFDTIDCMARVPASGTRLTNNKRMACVSCLEGKQTRNAQSQQDFGTNSSIDKIGGVILSDLKGPMTPQYRLGNRYLVIFIDHRLKDCRVYLVRTKDSASKQLKALLFYFEKRFGFKVHVLRTDGGGEYANVDMFCKRMGVARVVVVFAFALLHFGQIVHMLG